MSPTETNLNEELERKIAELENHHINSLFESVNKLRFVIKDTDHRYLYVNRVWKRGLGFTDEQAAKLIGKTAGDVFPKWRAGRYLKEEKKVMDERHVYDYEEYSMNHLGELERWRTIKAPWIVKDEVIGYVNLGTRLGLALEQKKDTIPVEVSTLFKVACEQVSIEDLSKKLNMSRRTFERRFKDIMNETPQNFRMRCRILKAKHLLRSNHKVIDVALRCGLNDQSHFSKGCSKHVGKRPKEFQQDHRKE